MRPSAICERQGGGSIVLAPLVPRYQGLGTKRLKYQPWRFFLFSLFHSSYLVFSPFLSLLEAVISHAKAHFGSYSGRG